MLAIVLRLVKPSLFCRRLFLTVPGVRQMSPTPSWNQTSSSLVRTFQNFSIEPWSRTKTRWIFWSSSAPHWKFGQWLSYPVRSTSCSFLWFSVSAVIWDAFGCKNKAVAIDCIMILGYDASGLVEIHSGFEYAHAQMKFECFQMNNVVFEGNSAI